MRSEFRWKTEQIINIIINNYDEKLNNLQRVFVEVILYAPEFRLNRQRVLRVYRVIAGYSVSIRDQGIPYNITLINVD